MADKGRLSVEQRIKAVLFFTETRSKKCNAHTEAVSCPFQTRWAPSFQTIHKLYNHDGSVLKRKCCRPSSVRSQENIDTVRVALQRSPSKSTRKAAMNIEKLFEFISIQSDSVA
jgi:hypothetical protein